MHSVIQQPPSTPSSTDHLTSSPLTSPAPIRPSSTPIPRTAPPSQKLYLQPSTFITPASPSRKPTSPSMYTWQTPPAATRRPTSCTAFFLKTTSARAFMQHSVTASWNVRDPWAVERIGGESSSVSFFSFCGFWFWA
ncbi:hypothetical protein BC829DRAFT_378171, partial [Chytridium lagenaria]